MHEARRPSDGGPRDEREVRYLQSVLTDCSKYGES